MTDGGCAIVGMGCTFPRAPDVRTFWSNLCAGVDAIGDLPGKRWDPIFYDPDSTRSDRLRCRRGGFIEDAYFDPVAYGIMPMAARAAEPDQLLALQAADRALRDLTVNTHADLRLRTGVVLGRGSYTGPARIRFEQHMRTAEQLVVAFRDLMPTLDERLIDRVREYFQSKTSAPQAEGVIGLVPNLAASRIAQCLDLSGPAYTVDAACASALFAVDLACQDLRSGRADMMLAGGVHLCHAETFWAVFSHLGALSRSQTIRPFDERADGILIGEGVGVVAMKRVEDALRDQDRIYAIVRGVGTSSDGRAATLMSPSVEGQLLAMQRSWTQAGLQPEDLGLLEAHGTATVVGDSIELEGIRRFFDKAYRTRPGLGSVKSNIGHAMPAAAAAGLLKAALAVFHGQRPKTLNAERPHQALDATGFSLVQETQAWESEHRIAAVSAFGFGGTNAHLVLESAPPARSRRLPRRDVGSDAPPLMLTGGSRQELLHMLDTRSQRANGPHRLAIVNPTAERVEKARRLLAHGRSASRDGIFYSAAPLLQSGGKLAFLFPGLDASFNCVIEDITQWLDITVPPFCLDTLEQTGTSVMSVNLLMHAALSKLDIQPDFVAGHSIGEWSAMVAAGVLRVSDLEHFNRRLLPGSLAIDRDVVFAAVACSLEEVAEATIGINDVEISHDNCPHQVIVCGLPSAIEAVSARLHARGVIVQLLPFGSGVHTRFFREYLDAHARNIDQFVYAPATVPIYSATTCALYPSKSEDIRRLLLDHMVERVQFRQLVNRLYADGARVFIQVGSGSLVGFVEDTLRDQQYRAIPMVTPRRTGLDQLTHVACALFVEGASPRLDRLPAQPLANPVPGCARFKLALDVPLVRFPEPLPITANRLASHAGTNSDRGVVSAFSECVGAVLTGQAKVSAAWSQRQASRRRNTFEHASSTTSVSLESFPEILDHTFFRQRHGWSKVEDLAPVVPMTGLLELMRRGVQRLFPERRITGFERVWALRWLSVTRPLEIETRFKWVGEGRVEVELSDYARGTVLLDSAPSPKKPNSELSLVRERPSEVDAASLYADHFMFHGPAYQGVVRVGPIADNGIRGRLRCGPALGALLDNAGQLLGYWMLTQPSRSMAMPVRIAAVRYLGPDPTVGSELECTVQVHRSDSEHVLADIQLTTARGQPWVRIEGWEDRCIPADDALWSVVAWPDKGSLSGTPRSGLRVLEDRYRGALVQQYIEGRYLTEDERRALDNVPREKRRDRLAQIVVAKDAARAWYASRNGTELFPAEVTVAGVPGEMRALVRNFGEIYIGLAVVDGLYVACAGAARVDIAIVSVKQNRSSLTTIEERLVEAEHEAGEWHARLDAAKAAAGLTRPNSTSLIACDRRGEAFLIDDRWIETACYGTYAIGWISK